jgi:anti-anti-sigma factor
MTTPLNLDITRSNDGQVVVMASGEIDQSNIHTFEQVLATGTMQAAGSGEALTVDLSAVEYLDSAAINILFTNSDRIDLVVAQPLVIPILTISGITEVITTKTATPTQTPLRPD